MHEDSLEGVRVKSKQGKRSAPTAWQLRYGNISTKYPDAERKLIAGILHVKVPCGGCGLLIWSSAGNTRALCNTCVPMVVAAVTENTRVAQRPGETRFLRPHPDKASLAFGTEVHR